MRKTSLTAVGMFVADFHLCHDCPVARSAEPDWYAAMLRPIRQLCARWHELKCPAMVYAGDVFDRWRVPPELLNFAIANLPVGYGIDGNHELPYHDRGQIKKSPYWTLVESSNIVHLDVAEQRTPHYVLGAKPMNLYGFPFGRDITPPAEQNPAVLNVAVVHRYVWHGSAGFPGAKDADRASVLAEQLRGYDVAVFGDNHEPFMVKHEGLTLYNCGAFIRRKRDERQYQPGIGILWSDGSMTRELLDTREDLFSDGKEVIKIESREDAHAFVESLRAMDDAPLDFQAAVRRAAAEMDLDPEVRQLVLEAIDG